MASKFPVQFKDGITALLRKPKGDGSNARDHYHTLSILDHLGKDVVKFMVKPFASVVAAGISRSQFGATPKRSTPDAIAIVGDVFRRFRRRG